MAKVGKTDVSFYDADGTIVNQKPEKVDWSVEQAQKGGYPHFMLKEINEEPEALRKTVEPRIKDGIPFFGIDEIDGDLLSRFESIHIVACGTAMHAGLVGKAIIEKLARVPVNVEIASEFRYRILSRLLHFAKVCFFNASKGQSASSFTDTRFSQEINTLSPIELTLFGSSTLLRP